MRKAVFLDRDGVINRKPVKGSYITRWEDFEILPGAAEAIRELNRAKLLVIVVTNQRCIAKGLITSIDLEGIHQRMLERMAAAGARIDAIYYCPHDAEPVCNCRKPAPGMLLEAAGSYAVDLTSSWMVGDSEIDMEAGKNAGCRTIRILEMSELAAEPAGNHADANLLFAASLLDAVDQILGKDNRAHSLTPVDASLQR